MAEGMLVNGPHTRFWYVTYINEKKERIEMVGFPRNLPWTWKRKHKSPRKKVDVHSQDYRDGLFFWRFHLDYEKEPLEKLEKHALKIRRIPVEFVKILEGQPGYESTKRILTSTPEEVLRLAIEDLQK